MATFTKFNQFVQDLTNGKHNLGSDNLKLALSNTAPVATNQVFTDITEITAQNGYTAGGTQATQVSNTQTSGTDVLKLNNVTFTASGGSFGPFRYIVMYNSTQTSPNHPLVAFWDFGSATTITNGNSFQVQFDATNGVLQLA